MILNTVGGDISQSFTIKATAGAGGTISPSGTVAVIKGGAQPYSIIPSGGYVVDDVVVDTESKGAITTYTFNNVTANHVITASFKLATYAVTTSVSGGNGTISANPNPATHGQPCEITCTPNEGYKISSLVVNSVDVTSSVVDNKYTIPSVTQVTSAIVTYTPIKLTITIIQGTHGSISPAGTQEVNYGDTPSYTITAETGYDISDILVNGVSTGQKTSPYTFAAVKENKTLTATFAVKTFTVTASVTGGHGTVSVNPATVEYNQSCVVTFTPDTSYHVKTFTINGTAHTVTGNTYTIDSIQENKTCVVEYIDAITGSFYIDKTELATSPTTCVHYNDGMTQTEAKTTVWGWLNPSVVKNGTVQYFLDKSDLSKKLDGTAANLDGTDGDVMVSIAPLWWKVITNDSSKLEIKISDASFDGAVTAHTFNGTVRKYLHVGMFHMSGSAAKSVYSTSATPWVNMTNDTARTTATAVGDTYCSMTGLTWALIQILTVFASGSCDSQTTCGQDYTGGSSAVAVGTSAMLTANGWTESTKTSTTTQLMWMFLACPWGNVYDWISGFKSVSSVWGIINDQQQARDVTVSEAIPDTWSKTLTFPSANGYISEVQGVNEAPFFYKSASGSSSTYYCDYGYKATGTKCAYVGGRYGNGADAGVFGLDAFYSASFAYGDLGARLQCLDVDNA